MLKSTSPTLHYLPTPQPPNPLPSLPDDAQRSFPTLSLHHLAENQAPNTSTSPFPKIEISGRDKADQIFLIRDDWVVVIASLWG